MTEGTTGNQDNLLRSLTLKIGGENRATTIVMIVLLAVFALAVAFGAVVYVLGRRRLAEAQKRLKELEEEIQQAEEKAALEKSEEAKKKLLAKAEDLKKSAEESRLRVKALEEKTLTFEGKLDSIKKWDDLEVEGPS